MTDEGQIANKLIKLGKPFAGSIVPNLLDPNMKTPTE